MPTLFSLSDEVTHLLVALLARDDIIALTNIPNTALRTSPFQAARDSYTKLVVPHTPDRARVFLARVRGRLANFQCIQVSTPWQVDLLVQYNAAAVVRSVCVEPIQGGDARTVAQICEKLSHHFPLLEDLDVSGTALDDDASLGDMTQLKKLNVSRTALESIDNLVDLVNLEVFLVEETRVTSVYAILVMADLRILKVTKARLGQHDSERRRQRDWSRIVIPTMDHLDQLETLVLNGCRIEDREDLLASTSTLQDIRIYDVNPRRGGYPPSPDPIMERLTELVTMVTYDTDVFFSPLDSIAGLVSRSPMSNRFANLQEINITLYIDDEDEGFVPDYALLRRLPNLSTIRVCQRTEFPWEYNFRRDGEDKVKRNSQAFADVLVALPSLKRLDYEGFIDPVGTLPRLSHLESLTLRNSNTSPGLRLATFDWITSFSSLRFLDVDVDVRSHPCDITAIGTLTHLKELWLCYRSDTSDPLLFLAPLVHLKALQLVSHLQDLIALRGMVQLEKLTIESPQLECVDQLVSLVGLKEIDVAKTSVRDAKPLLALHELRTIAIPEEADCSAFVAADHLRLVRVLHPQHNCLVECPFR